MAEDKPVALKQVEQFMRGLTIRQRMLLVGGAALVGGALWLFVWLLGKPKYTTLYSGLRPGDAQSLATRLGARGIPYELSPDGSSILVPAEQVDASRLETAAQGLPRNARMGFELFDNPNWTGSDFSEKVNYQRALEGELERTLQTLGEIQAVRVHLALPRESLFTEQERDAKAAIIVKTNSGSLSERAQRAIPQLVASAVDKLRPEHVTVVDADTSTSLLHSGSAGPASTGELDEQLSRTLVRTLEPVVGADHVRASVHVEYDLSTSDNTDETYDPKLAATTSTQHAEENMGGGAPAGIPGTASNVPGSASVPAASANQRDTQSSRSESSTFAVSRSIHHTLQPAGRLKRVAAAVLVDDVIEPQVLDGKQVTARRKRTAEEMKQLEQLAQAAIGLDSGRGDILAIENLSFQEMAVQKPDPPGALERPRQLLQQWSWLVRYGAIGLLFAIVYFLLLRPVKRELIAAFRSLPGRIARSVAGPEPLAVAAGSGTATLEAINLPPGTEQARRASTLKHQLTEKVRSEPATASRLVQGWIREDKTK